MRYFRLVSSFLASSLAYGGGLVAHKSKEGVQFSDALSITVNDKDKALSLGSQPKLVGPLNKLPQVKMAATLVKDTASGTVVIYSPGQPPQFLLPLGLQKNTQPNPGEAWKSAKLSFRKSQSEKVQFELAATEFLAFLPEGVPGLAALCIDPEALNLLGGKDGYLPAQTELITAAVKAYPLHPAMASVESYVRQTMRRNLDRFDAGIESAASIKDGLQFARLSEQAYAALPEHQQLRKLLGERGAWLNRRIAILRALHAADDWDTFLLAYRDFEKHQPSFVEVRDRKRQALQESLKAHWARGKERLSSREYQSAYRELQLASARQPSNAALSKDLSVAWSEYSRELAGTRRARRTPLTPGQQEAITQAIHFATRYKEQNKLDEALKSLREAESIDAGNLPLLLKEAEILGARSEFARALATLDKYDGLAVDEDRLPGIKLRNELAFQVTNALREERSKLEAAWAAQRYHLTVRLASQALQTDDRDPGVLYFAGLSSLVTHDAKQGRELLARYLETSNTIDAEEERRISALRLLASSQEEIRKTAATGEQNWFSGMKLPADVYYCPVSLAFGPRVERIDASNKLAVRYEWDGPRLKAIVPSFDKPQNATGERPALFAYESSLPQVIAVQSDGGSAVNPAADRDGLLKSSSVVLLNSPLIDPAALERVTGKKVTMVVTGNRFFHPFIWQKLHYFQLSYDEAGRVRSAREVPGAEPGQGSETNVEFDWDGMKLMAVRAFQGGGQVYERRQQYQDNRLVGEEVKVNGKVSHIKYVYEGPTLVSAQCDKDESIDHRSRTVFFASRAARPGRR